MTTHRIMQRLSFAMLAAVVMGLAVAPKSTSADTCPPAGCFAPLGVPDLRVTDLDMVTIAGQRWLKVEVRNTGTAYAGTYKVDLSFPAGAFGGVVQTFTDVNGLIQGGTQNFYYKMPACSNPGALLLTSYEAEVDPANLVLEMNNLNNTRSESWFFYC